MPKIGLSPGCVHPMRTRLTESFNRVYPEKPGDSVKKNAKWTILPGVDSNFLRTMTGTTVAPWIADAVKYLRSHDLLPQVYVHAKAEEGTPKQYKAEMLYPSGDLSSFLEAIKESFRQGYPLRELRVYYDLPDYDFVHQVVKHFLDQTLKRATVAVPAHKATIADLSIAVAKQTKHPEPGSKSKVLSFSLTRQTVRSRSYQGHQLPHRPEAQIERQVFDPKLLREKDGAIFVYKEMLDKLVSVFYRMLKAAAIIRFEDVAANYQEKVHRILMSRENVAAYGAAKGFSREEILGTVPKPGEQPASLDPDSKYLGGNPRPKEARSRSTGSGVAVHITNPVPSTAISDDNYSGFIPTAYPEQRIAQLADGTFTKVDRQRPHAVSEGPPLKAALDGRFPSFFSNSRYYAYLGLRFESPLLQYIRAQTWWYPTASMAQSATAWYAHLTGDRALPVLFVVDRYNQHAIGFNRVRSSSNPDLRDIIGKWKKFRELLDNSHKQGFQAHKQYLEQNKLSKMAKLWELHKNNFQALIGAYKAAQKSKDTDDLREWRRFLKTLRKDATQHLYIRFRRGDIPDSESKPYSATLTRSSTVQQHRAMKRGLKKAEFWGSDESKPWNMYYVEYLIAYGQSSTGTAPSYMIPVNVVEKPIKGAKPRKSVTKVEKGYLRDMMGKLFRGPMFRAKDEWEYIKGSLQQPFPYPRLIRRYVIQPAGLKYINKLFKGKPVTRTSRGYKIGNKEFESWSMVVMLPPNVAREKLKLVGPGGSSKFWVDDAPVHRAIGQRGLLPFEPLTAAPGAEGTSLQIPSRKEPGEVLTRTTPPDTSDRTVGARYSPRQVGIADVTALPPGYFERAGQHFRPNIRHTLVDSTRQVLRAQYEYERETDAQKQERMWNEFDRRGGKRDQLREKVMTEIRKTLGHTLKIVMPRADLLNKQITQFLVYADTDRSIPEVVTKFRMSTYTAPVVSEQGRTSDMRIRAPSPEVAKLLMLYKLLRKSPDNPQLKNLAKVPKHKSRTPLFPFMATLILRHWAQTRFLVIAHDDVPGVRRIPQRQQQFVSKADFQTKRLEKFGEHKFARMVPRR